MSVTVMHTFNIKTIFLVVALIAQGSHAGFAATLILREHACPKGGVIYLGDVADISAANPSEMNDLLTTPLMAAPAQGTHQFLGASTVRDLLVSQGIDISKLSIKGSATVEIGTPKEHNNLLAVEPVQPATPAEAEKAVTAAIVEHLQNTTGHQDWEVVVEIKPNEIRDLCKLGRDLVASAGRTPWTGAQRFQISSADSQKNVLVLARVDRLRYAVVATRKILQGNLIGAADVELKLLGGNVPPTALNSLDQVIGKEALRMIDAESHLQATLLRAPLQVQRGETVKICARTAGITVSTFAIVQQDGSLGDLVQAQTLDKKDRITARVSGWKQLEVLPTGATVGDFANLNNPATQKR